VAKLALCSEESPLFACPGGHWSCPIVSKVPDWARDAVEIKEILLLKFGST
jgi:hypothetical protein